MLTDIKEPIDIDLSVTSKQRFRINGNNDRILELNISDMGIVNRLNDTLPKLKSISAKAMEMEADSLVEEAKIEDGVGSEETLAKIGKAIKDMDDQLRECVDYIFNSNVSEVCASDGTMYDMFNGKCRYEHILDKLTKLYADNIQAEYDKVRKRVELHTNKYTKSARKKK